MRQAVKCVRPRCLARMCLILLALTCLATTQQVSLIPSGMDGHLLDQNLSTIDGIYNRPRQGGLAFTIGNAIVTGNIGGGRGFRGGLGYRAARDFRGSTPVDLFDSYRFDTQQSGLSLQRIVTRPGNPQITSPLSSTFVNPVLSRSSSGSPLSQMARYTRTYEPPSFETGGSLGSLRTNQEQGLLYRSGPPAAVRPARSGRPGILPLRHGVAETRGLDAALDMNVNSDLPIIQAPPDRWEPRTSEPPGAERASPVNDGQRQLPARSGGDAVGRDSYADLVARMAETSSRAGRSPVSTGYSAQQLVALRNFRDSVRDLSNAGQEMNSESSSEDQSGISAEQLTGESPRAHPPLSLDELREIAEALPLVGSLAGSGRTLFDDAMRKGESSLSGGEYFRAEEQFNRALMVSGDEPMALVGKIHAQIGAGLFQAANYNLRRLFAEYPELVGVRYESGLVPARSRLIEVQRDMLRLRGAAGLEDLGLLVAYTGRLAGDDQQVRIGLEQLREHAPEDPILPLVEAIWLPRP